MAVNELIELIMAGIEGTKKEMGATLFICNDSEMVRTKIFKRIGAEIGRVECNIIKIDCKSQNLMKPYSMFKDPLSKYLEGPAASSNHSLHKVIEILPDQMVWVIPALQNFRSSWGGFNYLNPDIALKEIATFSEAVYEGFSRLVRVISNHETLVFLIQDLHWSDASSIQLLKYLSNDIRESNILIIGTYSEAIFNDREKVIKKSISEFEEKGYACIITYPNDEGEELEIQIPESSSKASPSLLGTEVDPNLLMSKINSLKGKTRMVLELVAAFSGNAEMEPLKCASEMDEKEIDISLSKLEDLGLVRKTGANGTTYELDPDLYDYLYTIMDSRHREAAHRKVGICIETLNRDDLKDKVFDLFFHFTIAKDFERIVDYGILAAEASEKMSAPHEVMSYYSQSLSALKALKDGDKFLDKKIMILQRLSTICFVLGEWEDAINYNTKLIMMGEKKDDARLVAESRFMLGEIYEKRSQYEEATQMLESSLSVFSNLALTDKVADCYRVLGSVFRRKGRQDKALASFTRGLELARVVNDPLILGKIHNDLGTLYSEMGDYEKAEQSYFKSIEFLGSAEDYFEVSRTYNNIAVLYYYIGNYDKSLDYLEKQIRLAQRSNNVRIEGAGYYNAAALMVLFGDDTEINKVKDYTKKAMEISRKLGDKHMIAASHRTYALAHTKLKEWSKAEDRFQSSLDIISEAKEPYYVAETHYWYGIMFEEKGDTLNAKKQLTMARNLWRNIGSKKRMEDAEEVLKKIES